MARRSPQSPSALEAVRPFRGRIALTYGLTFVEDLLELSYPWATGLAIDGLLAHDYRMAAPIILAWALRSGIGCFRKMYDTRLYTAVYNRIVVDTVLRQRAARARTSEVAARSAMSRDFVTFFERDVPVIFTSIVGVVGSAAILFTYDLVIGVVTASLFLPVILVNRIYSRRSLTLNEALNNELEDEVRVIEAADERTVRAHFDVIRRCRRSSRTSRRASRAAGVKASLSLSRSTGMAVRPLRGGRDDGTPLAEARQRRRAATGTAPSRSARRRGRW